MAAAELHVQREGNGEPLLLLHGLGSDLCVWDPVMPALTERYSVVALDLPGFGHSEPLPDGLVPTPAALAATIGQWMLANDVPTAHLAGNSLGGWIALELALLGRGRSVTGICPAGLWPAPLQAEPATIGRAQQLARAARPLTPMLMANAHIRRTVLSPFVAHPERVPYRAAWRMVESYARASAYAATSSAMRASAFSRLGDVPVPVVLAFGERDQLIRPVRVRHAGVRTVLLDDCGHVPMWDAPELVVRTIASAIENSSEEPARAISG